MSVFLNPKALVMRTPPKPLLLPGGGLCLSVPSVAVRECPCPPQSEGRRVMRTPPKPLLLPGGGYRRLKSFQIARLVYDLTCRFVELYVDPASRTCDQMTQAARSGVQNIAGGSRDKLLPTLPAAVWRS